MYDKCWTAPMHSVDLFHGDCIDIMADMDECSVDSIVTDPPYGLSFMGKGWDKGVPGVEFWAEALRVAKPGAHLLAFGGTRMVHRLAVAIEDAGWEIRDRVHWVYGSGFPKSHDVSKAIDKAAGAEREVVGTKISRQPTGNAYAQDKWTQEHGSSHEMSITAPATPEAQRWDGWGTALKPAVEPIILARKPFKGTVAANVLEWGTGAVNVDGCRVGDEIVTINTWDNGAKPFGDGAGNPYTGRQQTGRFPANLIHDGSDDATAGMGDASRYFYCPKASKKDRGEGNNHPTVKPTDLMRYLCRLITPPNGTILDPFMGSGSTGKAAVLEGFGFIGCDLDIESVTTAKNRIEKEIT